MSCEKCKKFEGETKISFSEFLNQFDIDDSTAYLSAVINCGAAECLSCGQLVNFDSNEVHDPQLTVLLREKDKENQSSK